MNNLPLDFQHPGGFVEEVLSYINKTSICPQPLFALGAALVLAGTLYGRKVQGSGGERTNLFVMSIGYTSSGKDQALKSIARILDDANASNLRLGQVTSDSAIEWALKRQPRLCLLIDEAGYFFANANDAKSQGAPQHSIKPALLELWSSAASRWIGKQRVPRDGKNEAAPVVIENPHLSLYSTSQPQILFEGLTRNDLRDGWLARNLFFISTTRPKPVVKETIPIPNAIKAEVLTYKDHEAEDVKALPKIVTVGTSEEAKAVFDEFNNYVYTRMLIADKSGDETNYLFGKALENSKRIALILAVSRAGDPLRAEISKADAEYATKLVKYLISNVIGAINESLSENADEKGKKRILKLIAQTGEAGLSRNELTRKTQFIRRAMREEYIADLLDAGEIVSQEYSTSHSRGEKLFLSEFGRQE